MEWFNISLRECVISNTKINNLLPTFCGMVSRVLELACTNDLARYADDSIAAVRTSQVEQVVSVVKGKEI